MNSYELSRNFFDWSFENPEKIKPNHIALYFFAIEHCNRLGWKRNFGLPTTMAKEAIGIRSYNTFINTLNDLVEWGFIEMVERSKNQHSSNVVALLKFDKALDKALDKAFIKHASKHSESTSESTSSIDKQINKEQINKEQEISEREFFQKDSNDSKFYPMQAVNVNLIINGIVESNKSDEFKAWFNLWLWHLANNGKKLNMYSQQLLYRDVKSDSYEKLRGKIENSIKNNWLTLIEPKREAKETTYTNLDANLPDDIDEYA